MDYNTMKGVQVGSLWRAQAALVAGLMVTLLVATHPGVEGHQAGDWVFPFRQVWTLPPAAYRTEPYRLGSLMPEWDETNSTWYIREAANESLAANYTILQMTATKQLLYQVSEGDPVAFQNVETGRVLGWREEGTDEYFLVEEEVEGFANISVFSFSYSTSQACARLYICKLYNVLDYSSYGTSTETGMAPYEEDGVTYFTRASSNLTSFPLLGLNSVTSLAHEAVLKRPYLSSRRRVEFS